MNLLALDLSSTATGVCTDFSLPAGATFTIKPRGDLLARARATRTRVTEELRGGITDVVLEAVATRHTQTAIAIATVHALVLDAIPEHVSVLTVSPAQLKKFATGKGNADKTAMLLAAKREGWLDPDGATDDQADAWWLWTLGHAVHGSWKVPETAYRAEVIRGIR